MRFLRPLPIAWNMLIDKPSRLALSVMAVAFSVVIMFMELGFFNGSNDSAANLPPHFDCDLILSHKEKNHLKTGEEFPIDWIYKARDVAGVAASVPLYSGADYWWNPQDGSRNRVFTLGVNLDDPMFTTAIIAANRRALQKPGAVIYDRLSRHELGQVESGTTTTLGRIKVTVVGLCELGPNFSYEGHVIMSADTFLLMQNQPRDVIDLGLIRVQPGADVNEVRQRLLAALPPQALLLTPAEINTREIRVTTQRSPAGIVFGIGLVVGFAIGVIICYQILFNEVNDHLPQFATLKAMGHPPRFISGIVLHEAVLMALAGFIPGLIAGFGLYMLIEHFTQIRMFLTPGRVLLIFVLTSGMCLLAGHLALKKVHSTDPADLF
ncbi:FtsX-like permease family protein [Rariglobus hedericola]|uniref:FtsX-like permease family protein n=1 Tax=Rariglobus hedericola TaxID=2597822 RepID=A0A556QQW9_9BACT|nr:FtsX-like permease family protein [Rariglobus hedericola]TSJ79023.1 FtsX-like permease family protein [Rariglobus hedericola]